MSNKGITRRHFISAGAAAGLAAMGAASIASASEKTSSSQTDSAACATDLSALASDLHQEDIDASSVELETITEFADEQTYDIVVVGAGVAGIPAVATALEEGASVACLQKESSVSANGNGFSCVIKGESNDAGIKEWMNDWAKMNDWRINPALFQHYVDYSEEAISFIIGKADENNVEFSSYDTSSSTRYPDGGLVAVADGVTPGNQTLMTALAEQAEKNGATFYYSTPCVQLVQESDGKVTGAIGKREDGSYIKLNANKGVILCCGDYMNNTPMLSRNVPEATLFPLCLIDHTGDGHILGILAGGRMAPLGHARQIHTDYIGPLMFYPFLCLAPDGERFCNETIPMSSLNIAMARSGKYTADDKGLHYRIFDSALDTKYPGCVPASYIDEQMDDSTNPWASTDLYYRADTIEELVEAVGMPEAAIESVKRWNEMCAQGRDDDFGVPADKLQTIDTPPYYCMKSLDWVSGINAGIMVDSNYQVVDKDNQPIPGLFAAGIDAGNACGGINWNMPGGFSNGGFYTAGRYSVIYALKGENTPSHPHTFEDVSERFKTTDGDFYWQRDDCATEVVAW